MLRGSSEDERLPQELLIVGIVRRGCRVNSKKEFIEAGRRGTVEVCVRVGRRNHSHTEPAEIGVAFGTLHLVTPIYLLHATHTTTGTGTPDTLGTVTVKHS